MTINEKINESLIKRANKVRVRVPHVYWPSQASVVLLNKRIEGRCIRQSFYEFMNFPITNPSSISVQRKAVYGEVIEHAEIEMAKELGICLGHASPFKVSYKNIIVSGKIDAIYQTDKIRGIEYKTSSGYYFRQEVFGTTTKVGYPKIPHLMQVMIYLDGVKDRAELSFSEIIIIYIDRDTCTTQEFVVTLKDGVAHVDGEPEGRFKLVDIYERFVLLDKYISLKRMPPPDFRCFYSVDEGQKLYYANEISRKKYTDIQKVGYGQDIQCSWCQWMEQCKKDNLIR